MSASRDENRLKFACDAGIFSNESTPLNHDDDSKDSNEPTSSGSRSCDSPPMDCCLGASLRLFADSLVRMEQAETEMIRVRETLQCEAEKRRMEMESELTRMMLATELQIASIVAGRGLNRKRKRIEENEDESTISWRKQALLRCLLHCNFSF